MVILLALVAVLSAEVCRVVGVSDGDTITALCAEKRREKIRLAEIDAPEKAQPYGSKAKAFASSLVFGKDVEIKERERDRYGRLVADVELSDGRSLNQEMVRAGLAWRYLRYSKTELYSALEAEAREEKRGLWADAKPTPPWKFRSSKRQRRSAQSQ